MLRCQTRPCLPVEAKAKSGEQTHEELGVAMYSIEMSCEDNLYTVIGGAFHCQFWFGRVFTSISRLNCLAKTTIAKRQ